MSQVSLSVAVAASIPQTMSVPGETGDKTPPYAPEESLKDMFDPQSSVMKASSFFCQSLLREMSQKSLLSASQEKADEKELVSRPYSIGKPDGKSGLMTSVNPPSTEEQPGSAQENDTDGNSLAKSAEAMTQTNATEDTPMEEAQEIESIQERQKASQENSTIDIASTESTLDVAEVTNDLFQRSPIDTPKEEETEEPPKKRQRISSADPDPKGQTEPETPPRSESGMEDDGYEQELPTEQSKDPQEQDSNAEEEESEKEEPQETPEVSPEQTQARKSAEPIRTNKCSICGKRNCPLDPNRQTPIRKTVTPKFSFVKRLQSRGKAPLKFRPLKSAKTSARRSIGTRSSAVGMARQTADRSPFQLKKLKTQLFNAVEKGDLVRVQELIADTGAAVRRERTGCTLLHVAAAHNQVDVVMFLLNLISPNIPNKEGQTPAHMAASRGHTQVLRIFMNDADFGPDKADNNRNTIKTLLGVHLFKAVMDEDKRQIKRLVDLGADPDSHGGDLVKGTLARDLGVSTARLLAKALNMDTIVTLLAKVQTRHFHVTPSSTCVVGPDVYKMDKDSRGRVYILTFSSFETRSDLDLPQLDYDARILSQVFDNMGYVCETHSCLTAAQTKEMLKSVRDAEALSEAGCAIFIISGYSVNGRKILTSDMQSLDVDSVCSLFKDSECPRLRKKPKLFFFNLCSVSGVSVTSGGSEASKSVRLEEPLSDMAVMYSNSIGLRCKSKGSGFSWTLCRTLADHAHGKELGDLYREFLTRYNAAFPDVAPELSYFGFNKKFFFNPIKTQINFTN